MNWKMEKPVRLMLWLPRVMAIIFILFVSLFALDSFTAGQTVWRQMGAFIIHLIPSFVLTGILITAWKWEYLGGILFLLVAIGVSPFIFLMNYDRSHSLRIAIASLLMITLPFFIVGILFIISHFRKKIESGADSHTTI